MEVWLQESRRVTINKLCIATSFVVCLRHIKVFNLRCGQWPHPPILFHPLLTIGQFPETNKR